MIYEPILLLFHKVLLSLQNFVGYDHTICLNISDFTLVDPSQVVQCLLDQWMFDLNISAQDGS